MFHSRWRGDLYIVPSIYIGVGEQYYRLGNEMEETGRVKVASPTWVSVYT